MLILSQVPAAWNWRRRSRLRRGALVVLAVVCTVAPALTSASGARAATTVRAAGPFSVLGLHGSGLGFAAATRVGDGDIVVGGRRGGQPFAAKVRASGTLDETWGRRGSWSTPERGRIVALATTADGRGVVALLVFASGPPKLAVLQPGGQLAKMRTLSRLVASPHDAQVGVAVIGDSAVVLGGAPDCEGCRLVRAALGAGDVGAPQPVTWTSPVCAGSALQSIARNGAELLARVTSTAACDAVVAGVDPQTGFATSRARADVPLLAAMGDLSAARVAVGPGVAAGSCVVAAPEGYVPTAAFALRGASATCAALARSGARRALVLSGARRGAPTVVRLAPGGASQVATLCRGHVLVVGVRGSQAVVQSVAAGPLRAVAARATAGSITGC